MRSVMRKRGIMSLLLLGAALSASASCGATDYSGSSGRLYNMVVYVVAMCSLTVELLYAIAAVLSIISATSIYVKMQAGEEGFTKSVMVLVGSCLFMIGATIVLPAFFGFQFG